jgi:CAAX protease family protein
VLHGLWHLPAYFIPGTILNGPFNLVAFVANTVGIIAATVVWTWLFNHTGGSVFFAMFIHGVSNAVSGLLPRLGTDTTDPWFIAKVTVVCALLLIVFTRGRLGYEYQATKQPETAA